MAKTHKKESGVHACPMAIPADEIADRPSELRNLRACKTCKLVKTYEQVRARQSA